jgi:mono/diheme cytochrome c family protein
VGGEPPPPGPTQEDVARIFSARCNGCHIGGRSGGLSLAGDFTGETVNVPSTTAILDRIEPGSRADSYLYRKVEGTQGAVSGGGGGRMPLGGQLTAEELETIGLWIDNL